MNIFNFGTKSIFVLAVLIMSSCTESRSITRTGTTPISQDFVAWYTTWLKSRTETHLYFTLRNLKGKVEVCGAVLTNGSARMRTTEPQFLKNNYLRIGNKSIINSLYFFNRLPKQEGEFEVWNAMGQTANCAVTDVDWQSDFDVKKVEFGARNSWVSF